MCTSFLAFALAFIMYLQFSTQLDKSGIMERYTCENASVDYSFVQETEILSAEGDVDGASVQSTTANLLLRQL